MPNYKHTFKKDTDFETAYAEAYTIKTLFGVPYDADENSVKLGTIEEAKAEFMKEAAVIVEEMKNKDIKESFDKGEVKEIVALIAYMNSLSQKRRTNAQ